MPKYQQTQPKKQGRNQRGRRPPAMVTVAAAPFDWRTFKPKDYVADPQKEDQGGLDLALRRVLKTAELMKQDDPVLARHLRVLVLLAKSFADADEARKSAAFTNLVSCVLGFGDELARRIVAINWRLDEQELDDPLKG